MKHTNLINEIDAHEGNDWTGMFFAGLLGLAVAIIITHMLFGQQLHYWIANMIV